MRCPQCNGNEDKVLESRSVKDGRAIRRRRKCLACEKRFTTYEEIVRAELYVIKNDGRREEFSPMNIRKGIERACWKRNLTSDDLDGLLQRVVKIISEKFEGDVSSSEVGKVVMQQLKETDEVAYIRFASIYRQFTDASEFISEVQEALPKKDV